MVHKLSANLTMALTRNIGILSSAFDQKRYVKNILTDREGLAVIAKLRSRNSLTVAEEC